MEPVSAVEYLVPIELIGLGQSDGGTGAVIDDLGSALGSALLAVVHAETRAAAEHKRSVNAVAAQLIDGALAYLMRGDLGDVG